MMNRLDTYLVAKLKDNIMGDNVNDSGIISGKNIVIERDGVLSYIFDKEMSEMTIAELNFVLRRTDLVWDSDDNMKIYYGHVGLFGYFIAEDEIETGPEKLTDDSLEKYLNIGGE